MATRSSIALLNSDASISSVYCHWDGYLEHNGKILVEHYATESAARYLLDHGNISVLARHMTPLHPDEHSFDKPEQDVCVFYRRDRNEDNEGSDYKTIGDWIENDFAGIEFYYLGIPVPGEHGRLIHWLYKTEHSTSFRYVSADLDADRLNARMADVLASWTGYQGE